MIVVERVDAAGRRSGSRAPRREPGRPIVHTIANRSSWLSGSGNVPARAEGVLGRDEEERIGQRVRDPVDRHLVLFHRLEQRGLGARRRPVDLVDEHHVGEHRTRPGTPIRRSPDRTRTCRSRRPAADRGCTAPGRSGRRSRWRATSQAASCRCRARPRPADGRRTAGRRRRGRRRRWLPRIARETAWNKSIATARGSRRFGG